MFFILSKTIGDLIYPSHFITVLAALGAILLCTRFGRTGRWLLKASLVLVLLLGLLPTGEALVVHADIDKIMIAYPEPFAFDARL